LAFILDIAYATLKYLISAGIIDAEVNPISGIDIATVIVICSHVYILNFSLIGIELL